jgi:hypothetical protein
MIPRIRPQPEHFAELRETLRITVEQFESIGHFNNAQSALAESMEIEP